MTTFRQLLSGFEESAKTRVAQGRHFEQFCKAFFRLATIPGREFDEVWAWMDWPGREGRTDTGIDLVAREAGSGDLVAIQCKFYAPTATLAWPQVSTFVGMLGQPEFASGMIVSTAGAESANVHSNIERHAKPVHIWRVDDFEGSDVDWDRFRIDRQTELALRPEKHLYAHQEQAITDVTAGLGDPALHRGSHQARRHRERAHRRDRRGIAEPRGDDCAAGRWRSPRRRSSAVHRAPGGEEASNG